MTPDYDQLELDTQVRLKAEVPTVQRCEGADDLVGALNGAGDSPALLTLISHVSSEGRKVHNSKAQLEEVELTIVAMTDSLSSKADGRKTNAALRRLAKIALVDWTPGVGSSNKASRPFRFVSERFFARSSSRLAYEMRFATAFWSTYTE